MRGRGPHEAGWAMCMWPREDRPEDTHGAEQIELDSGWPMGVM